MLLLYFLRVSSEDSLLSPQGLAIGNFSCTLALPMEELEVMEDFNSSGRCVGFASATPGVYLAVSMGPSRDQKHTNLTSEKASDYLHVSVGPFKGILGIL